MTAPTVSERSILVERKRTASFRKLNTNPRTRAQLDQLHADVAHHFQTSELPFDGMDRGEWLEYLAACTARVARREAAGLTTEVGKVFSDGPPPELLNGGGGMLDATGQRKVGHGRMRVWRHLVGLRGCADYWFPITYQRLGADLRIPKRTLVRHMARLQEAGLIEKDARHEKVVGGVPVYKVSLGRGRRSSVVTGADMGPGWTSTLDVRVLGAVDHVRGQEVVWVPAATIAWAATAPGRGGYRHGKRQETRVKVASERSNRPPAAPSGPPGFKSLDGQSGLSKISTLLGDVLSGSSNQKESAAAAEILPVESRDPKVCADPLKVTPASPARLATAPSASVAADRPPGCARPVRPAPVDPLGAALATLPANPTPGAVRAAIGAALALTMPGYQGDPVVGFVAMHRARARRGQHVHPAYELLVRAERSTTATNAPPG